MENKMVSALRSKLFVPKREEKVEVKEKKKQNTSKKEVK